MTQLGLGKFVDFQGVKSNDSVVRLLENQQQLSAPKTLRAPAAAPVQRVEFVDGLRGLAALYVVLTHAADNVLLNPARHAALPHWAQLALHTLNYGGFAVSLFIVLSGFCLMLPITKHPQLRPSRGWLNFYHRRVTRIVWPYYAVLALSLLVALVPAFDVQTQSRWDDARPAWSVGAIVSHLLMVHNLSNAWLTKINYAMWSIATEWQIYFVFPLLLVTWRRAGMWATVVVGFAIGAAAQWGLHLGSTRPWYVGLFALGMVAAGLTNRQSAAFGRLKSRTPWDVVAVISLAIAVVLSRWHRSMPVDCFVGISAFSAIMMLSGHGMLIAAARPTYLAMLAVRPVMWLGEVSYSLYLIHPIAVLLTLLAMNHVHATPTRWTLAMLAASVMTSALAAAVLHHTVERHCIPAKKVEKPTPRPIDPVVELPSEPAIAA